MTTITTERGAASILVELKDGGVNVIHGTDGDVLHSFPQVAPGTWDRLFDAVWRTLRDGELRLLAPDLVAEEG